jgi:hypothetical protein
MIALLLVSVGCGDGDVTTDPPVLGTIEVVTVTTGLIIDGDGYTITVSAGGDERTENIGANSSVTLSNLTAGTKSLLLDGIALNCQTTNNPRNVDVVAGQTTPAQFDVTCAGSSQPPVANAGPNQGVVDADNSGSEAVTLDGSGSTAADGTIVSWSWSVNGAEFGTGATLTVSASVGVHTVILTVTDDAGVTDTDDVVISVAATGDNLPPVANAGPNQSVLDANDSGSEAVTLDGSGSTDLDGTIASWSWSENSVEFGTAETVNIAFATGVHTVTLTVTDNQGATGTDSLIITVVPSAGNLPPIADAGPNQTIVDTDNDGSDLVRLDGSGSTDLDGTIASWSWSENSVEIGTGETLSSEFDVGVHTVTLTVTDDEGATDTDDVKITVQLPTLTGVAIFEFDDFGGDGLLLRRDVSDLGTLPGPCGLTDTWDDCISSILLTDGWSAILFEFDGFEGDSLIVVTSIADLDTGGVDWDNRTSSIKVRPPN